MADFDKGGLGIAGHGQMGKKKAERKNRPEKKGWLLNTILVLLSMIGIVATVFSCVLGFLAFMNPAQTEIVIKQLYSTTILTPEVIVVTAPVPPSPVPPTSVPLSSPTSTPFSMAKPTATSPPAPVAFFDDFDAGPGPEWEFVSGAWGMAAGQLTLIDISDRPASGVAMIDALWNDYVIDFDVTGMWDKPANPNYRNGGGGANTPDCYSSDSMNSGMDSLVWSDPQFSRAAILLGADAEGNGPGLVIGANYMVGGVFEDGLWNIASGTLVDGFGEEGTRLHIVAQEDTYKVYDSTGELLTSFSVSEYRGDRIGVWLIAHHQDDNYGLPDSDWRAVPKIDNFSVTPFE